MNNEVFQKKSQKTTIFVIYTIMIYVIFLSIGYSTFTATASIEGIMASVRPRASVRITGIELSSTTNGGISASQNYNVSNIYGSIELPNSDSTVTYKVDMTVFLGAIMKLTDITGVPSNLEYTISGYTFGDPICNSQNQCNYGATDDLYITIGYKSGEYNSSNTEFTFNLDFDFDTVDQVARVGTRYFETLQDAINYVPSNGNQTTVELLKNRSENVSIAAGKNINLDLGSYTLSNNGSANVIVNNGTLTISNGTISSNVGQGAVNNNSGATFYMTGGTITNSSSRQAIYNDGGTFVMSGGTLYTNATQRGALQNLNSGVVTITGGTITGNRFYGIDNTATLTIGTKDGTANQNSPSITGQIYGVNSTTNFNYYDGVIKGQTWAINNESKVVDKETGTQIVHKGTTQSNKKYDTVHLLSNGVQLTFNLDGGSMNNTVIYVEPNVAVGFLPTPEKSGYQFDGWEDAPSNGNAVNTTTTFSTNTQLYAQWLDLSTYAAAQIGGVKYLSLEDAFAAVPNNTQTTIELLDDVILEDRITTYTNHNVIFDLNGFTVQNDPANNNMPIFENRGGVVVIRNGTVRSNSGQGAINNRTASGSMTITNLNVYATGTRQAVYNEYGTTYITGNCYLSNTSVERAAVQNTNSGTIYIRGGTIVSENFSGIVNASGTVELGNDDGNVSTTSPSVRGATYGINNSSTFKFYDGILKGITHAIQGNVTAHDANTSVTTGSETIGSDTYETAYLQ